MADTMGAPAKAFKKKKAFAFLKSATKPAPSLDLEDGRFNKEADEDDDGLDLFRRSRDFFPVVVKEQENRQATPEEKREEYKRFSQQSTQSPSPPSSKRRKLSSPAHVEYSRDTEEDLYGPPTPPRRVTKSPSPSLRKPHLKQSTPSPAKGKGKERMPSVQRDTLPTPTRSNSNQPPANKVIALDDDDEEDVFKEVPTEKSAVARRTGTRTSNDVPAPLEEETPSPGPITIDDSDDDVFENPTEPEDDDPFAHFIERAREREAAAKAEAAAAASASRPEIQPSTPEGAPYKRREPMIEVKVFVQSRMARFPELGPFGAKRGMNQNLGVIRRTFLLWLRKMGRSVSGEDEAAIFLTWKRRKIYDVSTGVSLGWNPSVAEDPSSSSSTSGFVRGGVLLEAWTQEDFDEWIAEEERERMMQRGDLVEDVPDDEPVEEQVDDAKVRISIKEKDQKPFNLSVDKDMEIRLLVPAIRKIKKIPNDREIKLRYEGEWLEGNITVGEADIEDFCTVEMYLR
ncbi:hypothetical protein J7T55_012780 [Diaporthe amygdali]|uniref:uncharacterized protein n=1 Tax=Phomopsis amygdali TaxID=1214568 RepID=UPI0022FDBF5B|nr:uncharacterized protein J7T55_012780 [Diaporthe amygdali]KAJ0115500.1 hypothetical protein J7T55_012780 [Diaporthe amygdali]